MKKTGLDRREFIAGAALGAWAAGTVLAAPVAPQRPNFLLIVSDDHGAETGLLGTRGLQTPHMDRIAREGVLFGQAFVPTAPCSPTRTSMLTGHYPHRHNVRANTFEYFGPKPEWTAAQRAHNDRMRLPASMPTLIELLAGAGYRTGITSKFHMNDHGRFPFDAWHKPETAEVRQFIDASGGRPWFLMVNIRSPHRNFNGFQEGPVPDQATIDPPDYLPDTPTVREDWSRYLRAIQRTDNRVGEILAALEHSGRRDDTLVIYLGDHGPAYHRAKGSPYRFGLQTALTIAGPARHVKPRPEPVSELVSSLDLMPTILDYAGVTAPPGLPGRSLRPILAGQSAARGHDYLFGEIHHGAGDSPIAMQERGIYDGRYHLIVRDHLDRPHVEAADNTSASWGNRVYDEIVARKREFPAEYRLLAEHSSAYPEHATPRFEFYDVQSDRYAINNLYADPAHAAKISQLKAALRHWITATEDRYVDPDLLR